MEKNSLNRVILVGRLGSAPEGRFTKGGRAVVSFSLATNEIWNLGQKNQKDVVEWHSIVAWDKLADFSTKHLKKGQLISVVGSLRSRSWDDKEGTTHKTTEVFCSTITPLEWKKEPL